MQVSQDCFVPLSFPLTCMVTDTDLCHFFWPFHLHKWRWTWHSRGSTQSTIKLKGTFIKVRKTCDHCGYIWVWKLSAAILFSGSTPRKIFISMFEWSLHYKWNISPTANILGLYIHSPKQGPYTIVFMLQKINNFTNEIIIISILCIDN